MTFRALILALPLAGCFPYESPQSPLFDSCAASSSALDDSHLGWTEPACWSCHVEDAHNSGMQPWDCVTCHGTNGAPRGHTTSSPCLDCHAPPHDTTGFTDPDACLVCHPA